MFKKHDKITHDEIWLHFLWIPSYIELIMQDRIDEQAKSHTP